MMSTMPISKDTITLVGVVIGVFLLAMICLAFSLNPRELVDGNLLRCCYCCCGSSSSSTSSSRRRSRRSRGDQTQTDNDDEEQQEHEGHQYQSLNEYIFDSTDHVDLPHIPSLPQQQQRQQECNERHTMTMEEVFPDLLGSDLPPLTPVHGQQTQEDLESPLLGQRS